MSVNSTTGETGASGADPSFVDATRSISTYAASQGLAESFEAFLIEARKQEKAFWRDAFTPKDVNEYMRAGFMLQD